MSANNLVAAFQANVKYTDPTTPHGFSQFGFLQFNNLVAAHNSVGQVFAGTHAERLASYPAAKYSDGTLFYETDRFVLYVDVSGVWNYAAGTSRSMQNALPADLGAADIGFLTWVTDYQHLLWWAGQGWGWGPGESGSGMVESFAVAPGSGWTICDGSEATILQADGTTLAINTPRIGNAGAFGSLVAYFRI